MGKIVNELLLKIVELGAAMIVNKNHQEPKDNDRNEKTDSKDDAPSGVLKKTVLQNTMLLGKFTKIICGVQRPTDIEI